MNKLANDVLKFDWSKSNYRAGGYGVLGLAAFFVFILIFGVAGVAALFGAILGILITREKDLLLSRDNLFLYAISVLITYFAVAAVDNSFVVALIVFGSLVGVTVLAAHYRLNKLIAFYLLIWLIILLSAGQSIESPLKFTILYAVGLVISTVVIFAYEAEGVRTKQRRKKSKLTKDLFYLSALKGGIVGLSVLAGYALFPAHPMWAAITSLVILQVNTHTTVVVGIQRALGTALGVVVSLLLISDSLSNFSLTILLLGSAFAMVAFQKVNYILFSFFMTTAIVISQAMLSSDEVESATQRLGATILGVAIAFGSIYVVTRVNKELRKSARRSRIEA